MTSKRERGSSIARELEILDQVAKMERPLSATEFNDSLQVPVGTRVPIHCTASGKLYLSSLITTRRENLIVNLGLSTHTVHTIVETEKSKKEVSEIKKMALALATRSLLTV